ncbi:MAG: energy-coupling factor transporter transmembrane protein EcfT [Propionibacteriaceae bacterium]|nr:energy-coupling factor transporter transmembrane protein EcfT [Propionibacteriaceae bacterium]
MSGTWPRWRDVAGVLTLYGATGSWLERLDPRAKIGACLAAILAVILADSVTVKTAVVGLLLIGWLSARLGAGLLAITVASLAFFFLTTITLRGVIRGQHAADAVELGPLRYSPSGVMDGLAMCLQILGVILALTLLVRATEPIRLAEGMERLLSPFKRFGLPAHEAVMMFSIALRFLPIMVTEIQRMQTAQLARGGGVHRRGLRARIGALVPLLIPVVIVALVRAKELAEAMEARGYRGDVERTSLREYRLERGELVLLSGGVVLLLVAIATRVW